MATKKWLNIVVDGNTALGPHWPQIVSDYLKNITRCFTSNGNDKGAFLGLIFYNSDLTSYGIQFVNWTNNVDIFLDAMSSLTFNGTDGNQYSMAKGLAEALMMFPRPSVTMSTQEYYSAKRHCLLVTAGYPIPRRMLVSLPLIQEGQVVGQHVDSYMADFLEVAGKFVPLDVSLSLITPNEYPMFREIFKKVNVVSSMENNYIPNHGVGKGVVLLSKNFQEAHDVLHENRMMSLPERRCAESINTPTGIDAPNVITSSLQEGQTSTHKATTGNQIREAHNTLRFEPINSQPLKSPMVFPNEIDHMHVSSSSSKYQMNAYDDIIDELIFEGDIVITRKNSKTNSSNEVNMSAQVGANVATTSSTGQASPSFHNDASFGIFMIPQAAWNPLMQFQPHSTPMHPISMIPPSLSDLQDYVQTWEGSLAGKIQPNRVSIIKARAFKKATSSLSLTLQQSSRLEISFFLPEKAVNHTKSISSGPVDYMFFNILSKSNGLYNHLLKNNLCAKIDLPYQSIILSTTETERFFLGSVFPKETIFVEPL